jgi:hypothetical protein
MAPARPVERGFSPLDEELDLGSTGLTPQAEEGLIRLSTWLPFGRAAELLAALIGVQVSRATARRSSEAAGAAYAAVQTEEAEQIRRRLPQAPPSAEQQVISADGAFVPLRHGQWAEVKMLAIGEVVLGPEGEAHTEHLSYFARLAEAETFSQLALVETHRRGLERAKAVCAVTDGAEWLQGLLDEHCPAAVRILDFPHAAGYVSQIGQAVAQAGTQLPPAWLDEQLHTLKHAGPTAVLAALRQVAIHHPDLEEVRAALAYLEKREGQMQYPCYQAAGWPIGSGIVESANKLVMQVRLKGAGMHWSEANVNPMLALRTAACSDRWEEAWGALRRHQQQGRVPRRAARAQARLLAAMRALVAMWARCCLPVVRPKAGGESPGPVVVQPACASAPRSAHPPAADHPWRRPVVTHWRTA